MKYFSVWIIRHIRRSTHARLEQFFYKELRSGMALPSIILFVAIHILIFIHIVDKWWNFHWSFFIPLESRIEENDISPPNDLSQFYHQKLLTKKTLYFTSEYIFLPPLTNIELYCWTNIYKYLLVCQSLL